jgi:putative nucleotidyltransferase with HDIG domain
MPEPIASPQELLKRIRIPSLPRICTWLNDAVNNPRTSTLDIAELIGNDSALTARLLRLVNSSFYGFPAKIETPSQAVMIIGTAHLCDLALTTSIAKLFRDIPEDLVSMESFWQHSIASGLAARTLATYRHVPNVERFFVAGMLHDIGRLVLYQQAPAQAREALLRARAEGILLHQSEREVLGFDHAAVGAALLRTWALPASLEESVAWHHDPRRATRYPLETALVHLGDVVAQAMELGNSGERFVTPLEEAAWDIIELSPRVLPEAVDAVERQYHEVIRAILEESLT